MYSIGRSYWSNILPLKNTYKKRYPTGYLFFHHIMVWGSRKRDQTYKPSSVFVTIYLGTILLQHSSHPSGASSQRQPPSRCCIGQGLHGSRVPPAPVSSYLAFPSLPDCSGGIFLLHFPQSRLRLPLAGTLLCDARTFLTVIVQRCHTVCSHLTVYLK